MRRYRDFCDFPDGGCRHLEFSKIQNFNSLSAVGGQCASLCQISSKSVKRLQRYGDSTVLKMAAVRHLGFVKFEFFNGRSVKKPILHQSTEFRKDRSNRCGDIAFFCDFEDGGCRHLEFSKIRNFNSPSAVGGQYVRHYAKFHQNRSNGCKDMAI